MATIHANSPAQPGKCGRICCSRSEPDGKRRKIHRRSHGPPSKKRKKAPLGYGWESYRRTVFFFFGVVGIFWLSYLRNGTQREDRVHRENSITVIQTLKTHLLGPIDRQRIILIHRREQDAIGAGNPLKGPSSACLKRTSRNAPAGLLCVLAAGSARQGHTHIFSSLKPANTSSCTGGKRTYTMDHIKSQKEAGTSIEGRKPVAISLRYPFSMFVQDHEASHSAIGSVGRHTRLGRGQGNERPKSSGLQWAIVVICRFGLGNATLKIMASTQTLRI